MECDVDEIRLRCDTGGLPRKCVPKKHTVDLLPLLAGVDSEG